MSRVYFHSEQRTAELRGSERGWLEHVARGPAEAAWDLNNPILPLERCEQIIAMIPEVPGSQCVASYLHDQLREAREQQARNSIAAREWKPGQPLPGRIDQGPERQLIRYLRTELVRYGLNFAVAGQQLDGGSVALNTALVAGSDVIALAAKIHGWCESHGWIDGPDRKWLADLIDEGLRCGIYRAGLWYYEPGGKRKWSDQGWEDVTALLRETDDGPVVMSHSVTDGFPNLDIAEWDPVVDAGWMPEWAADDAGRAEWDEMSGDDQTSYRYEHANKQWAELSDDDQWRLGMEGLRAKRPWARIGPDTLRAETFGPAVTVYDLLAPDRDQRVLAACASEEQE
jgi:hypothetical protein